MMIQLSSVNRVVNIVVTHRWWHDDTANKSTNDNADNSTNSFADKSTQSFSTTLWLKDGNHDEMISCSFKQAEKISQNTANYSANHFWIEKRGRQFLHGLYSGEQCNHKNADFGPSHSCWSEKFIQENGSMMIALIWTFVSIRHQTFHQLFTSTLSSGSWSSYRPSVPTRAGKDQVKSKVVGNICLLGAFNPCSISERRRRWRERRTGWTCWPSRF